MRKIDRFRALLEENAGLFMCPVCGQGLGVGNSNSLTCANRHGFDLARSGYVNLLLHAARTGYDRELFEARRAVCSAGFFAGLTGRVCALLAARLPDFGPDRPRLLDAGCGEGSHLAAVLHGLRDGFGADFLGVGADISKEGIQVAAREHGGVIWCVADLARAPFMDGQFHALLNILSPANYAEFSRLLRDDGLLVKVVPGSEHLGELRAVLLDQAGRPTYSNEAVLDLFHRHFHALHTERVRYAVEVDDALLGHVTRMTPLSWNAGHRAIDKILEARIRKVNVDVTVLMGRKAR